MSDMKKAVIYIDVPEWQIGQDVTVFFPDTMMKKSKCELLNRRDDEFVMPCKSAVVEIHDDKESEIS